VASQLTAASRRSSTSSSLEKSAISLISISAPPALSCDLARGRPPARRLAAEYRRLPYVSAAGFFSAEEVSRWGGSRPFSGPGKSLCRRASLAGVRPWQDGRLEVPGDAGRARPPAKMGDRFRPVAQLLRDSLKLRRGERPGPFSAGGRTTVFTGFCPAGFARSLFSGP